MSTTLAHDGQENGCNGYDREINTELLLLSERAAVMPTSLAVGKSYELILNPQSEETMLAEPHRLSLDDASFAVILPLSLSTSAKYRISVSSESWVDVVKRIKETATYEVVPSTDFSGRFECKTLRKLVEYDLNHDDTYYLQLTGSPTSKIQIVITVVKA
tara:strand:- start:747 stop:1226 length:480 start_codon:yes stop_codon:yes gene_type:complete